MSNPFISKFPCPLSQTGRCIFGGNKRYNYGFMSGIGSYCRKSKQWIYSMLNGQPITCPIKEKDGVL